MPTSCVQEGQDLKPGSVSNQQGIRLNSHADKEFWCLGALCLFTPVICISLSFIRPRATQTAHYSSSLDHKTLINHEQSILSPWKHLLKFYPSILDMTCLFPFPPFPSLPKTPCKFAEQRSRTNTIPSKPHRPNSMLHVCNNASCEFAVLYAAMKGSSVLKVSS
jgi:hypothetical protein